MSCNGCRVLRKGCRKECMLRDCLQWIENPQSQAHATVFVAKFFGRAALMSFLSSVPTNQRSPLFQSLLFEAVGRTINPVNGAVGLLWTGNWHLCQLGVETVLRGGALSPLPEFSGGASSPADDNGYVDSSSKRGMASDSGALKRRFRSDVENFQACNQSSVRICLRERVVVGDGGSCQSKKRRAATPSEESGMTTLGRSAVDSGAHGGERKLLRLFF